MYTFSLDRGLLLGGDLLRELVVLPLKGICDGGCKIENI